MNISRMLDLTQDLYPNCPNLPIFEPPKFEYQFIGPRDGWKMERITMTTHSGTHMDAPSHMEEFRTDLDEYPVERFQGECVYIPLAGIKGAREPITPADLAPYLDRMNENSIVLLYTGWGEKRAWTKEWVYGSPFLHPDGARLIAEKKVKGIGIDHPSLGGTGEENENTHRTVLGAGIWIAEGLQLDYPELSEGQWHIMALPMKIRESSGAPARIVALQLGGGKA
ncbi:cyclase family protein [Paenibacillus thalictri]|uniref:Cyclase family protein n=1 Tax=Paenibacillus thalictri TaxID=2527873 RepID=A0A4Q9DMZ2_9BACL|nr:cyclase family protein [Paenibacillus thalictri]TBL75110.1 cyclase family protein [Paenibacillus thalictri]